MYFCDWPSNDGAYTWPEARRKPSGSRDQAGEQTERLDRLKDSHAAAIDNTTCP
jgi:hypothetical protein